MGFWNQFEGQILDGQFKLSKYTGMSGDCAVFLSELAGQEQFVAVNVLRSASVPAEQLNNSWKIAKDLQHPNLIRVVATATADLDGLRVLYAVVDYPDASLASVIQKRCLDEEEGRELLVSCAEALQYLHQKGIVHRRVRPSNILAVDTATKLSIDFLSRSAEQGTGPTQLDGYDAPEVSKAGYSPASDMWALGTTLFEALTQRLPDGNSEELDKLPGPFPELVRGCLEPNPAKRWSARQILSYFQSGASAAATVAARSPQGASSQTPARKSRPVVARSPERKTAVAPQVKAQQSSKPNLLRRSGLLIRKLPLRYGISAILILLSLIWLGKTSQTYRRDSSTANAGGFAVPNAAPSLPVPATVTTEPSPTPVATRIPEPRSATADRAGSVWRVVLYTYANTQGAQAKVRSLNAKAPALHAQVLSLKGSHLVVAGDHMTRDVAADLRKRLLSEGFPKDIYIQNFPE